jgi:hypothetical protein
MDKVEPPRGDEDEGLIDKVADVVTETVDEVLGEDLVPPEPEGRWERRQRILDSWTALILGLAAVATAWASFQAGQWASSQADAQSASAIARSESGRSTTEASRAELLDSQMWLNWLDAVAAGNTARATFLRERFSPELASATTAWLGAEPTTSDVPQEVPSGTPFEQPAYSSPAREQADQLATRAESLLADASQSSATSTSYVLVAVVLALSLFFAGVATKFADPQTQVILISIAIVVLVGAIIRMLLLPTIL